VKTMPRGDKTGPIGMGKMTGRSAGYCKGFAVPGYANPIGFGCGFRRGRGFQRISNYTGQPRWGQFGYPVYNETNEVFDEKELLSNQAKFLEKQLEYIKESSFKH
jgi:hypothetical protein